MWVKKNGMGDFHSANFTSYRVGLIAAERGLPEVLQYCPITFAIFKIAVKFNQKRVVEKIMKTLTSAVWGMYCRRTMCVLAEEGKLEMFEFLYQLGNSLDADMYNSAAEGGRIEMLQFLKDRDCPSDYLICSSAAIGGHLDAIKWAVDENFPCSWHTAAYAAENGHLEVVQWYFDSGYEGDREVYRYALDGRHLDIIAYLDSIGQE